MGGAQKGAKTHFFPSPATIFFLSFLFLGSFRGIVVRGPEMCTFGVLGLSCEVLASARELQMCTFQGPGPQFHGRTKEREKKERILWREREKKERNFGRKAVRRRGVRRTHEILNTPPLTHLTTEKHNTKTGLAKTFVDKSDLLKPNWP